jgi:hypothetical protein
MTEEDRIIRQELSALFSALEYAKLNGLEYEFMEFFLRDYGNNKSVPGAIWYANYEWDL